MTIDRPRLFCILILTVLIAGAAWFGWRWYTTPVPPDLPLERMDKAVADAMRTALEEVRRAPRSGAAWGKLAMVAAANGYQEQSLVCLVQAERFDPAEPRWPYLHGDTLLAGRPHEALPLLERALERATSREHEAAIRFRLALALIEDGQLDAAEEHLDALGKLEPDGARWHFGLGLVAAAREQRAAAREHLEAVLKSPFGCKQAHARLAALALADGDDALARSHQQRYAQQPADIPWPDPLLDEMHGYAVGRQSRFLQAEGLEARGRLPEAVALLRRIAADQPDARSYLALGRALGNLGAYGEAEPLLHAVVGREPDNVQAHHFLGTVLFLQGEQQAASGGSKERAEALLREAICEQDRVLAIQADHAMAHLMRGRALAALGETEEALAALRQAVLCRPEFSDTHLYLGETLGRAGRRAEALPHLQDAVRLARPGDNRPRQALAKWGGGKGS
jgi:tetratricopeptide (TPR) repeat protein